MHIYTENQSAWYSLWLTGDKRRALVGNELHLKIVQVAFCRLRIPPEVVHAPLSRPGILKPSERFLPSTRL